MQSPKSKQQDRCKEFFRLMERMAASVHVCVCARLWSVCVYIHASLPSQLSAPSCLINTSSRVFNVQIYILKNGI